MSDELKLEEAIAGVLAMAVDEISDDTSTETCQVWDSLRHLNLILTVEQACGVRFQTDRIPDLTSVGELRREIARLESA